MGCDGIEILSRLFGFWYCGGIGANWGADWG